MSSFVPGAPAVIPLDCRTFAPSFVTRSQIGHVLARKSRIVGVTFSGSSSRNRCPPPLTTCRRASGIRAASRRALPSGTLGSCSPAMTSVGRVRRWSHGRLDHPATAERLKGVAEQVGWPPQAVGRLGCQQAALASRAPAGNVRDAHCEQSWVVIARRCGEHHRGQRTGGRAAQPGAGRAQHSRRTRSGARRASSGPGRRPTSTPARRRGQAPTRPAAARPRRRERPSASADAVVAIRLLRWIEFGSASAP